jgi:hypothetical protein
MSNPRNQHSLHVHVNRLVVDAGALHGEPVELLRAQLSAAVRQALGDASVNTPVGSLATQVGAVVGRAVNGHLSQRMGPHG